MDPQTLADLEDCYEKWQEAEMRFVHEGSVCAILEDIDTDNHAERAYQLQRLKYSPAYFSGHPMYCGVRLGGSNECFLQMLNTLFMNWTVQQ